MATPVTDELKFAVTAVVLSKGVAAGFTRSNDKPSLRYNCLLTTVEFEFVPTVIVKEPVQLLMSVTVTVKLPAAMPVIFFVVAPFDHK